MIQMLGRLILGRILGLRSFKFYSKGRKFLIYYKYKKSQRKTLRLFYCSNRIPPRLCEKNKLFKILLTNSCHNSLINLYQIKQTIMNANAKVLDSQQLLIHWQGHRNLTRRVIEAFPEKDLFEFSIGGMRPFAKLALELLAIGGPALKSIVEGTINEFDESFNPTTKAEILAKWDEETETINEYFSQISEERFQEMFNLFGQYEFPIYQNILYFVDNEIHHRGQGYVYLRALGIEPPFFWERQR